MKKSIICMIISILMIVSLSVVSFAAYYGDVNDDNLITAADARTILRVAAKLDKLDDEKIYIADMDANGRITAADARTVLRISAKLENLQEVTTEEKTTQKVENETTTAEVTTAETTTVEKTTTEITTTETTVAETTTVEVYSEEVSTDSPEVHEHDFVSVKINEASCSENGLIVSICVCGYSEKKIVNASGHKTEWQVVAPADVGIDGFRQLVCTECNTVLDSEIIPAFGDVDEESVTKEPVTEPDDEPASEESVTMPEEESYPEGIDAFLSGRYYISGIIPDESDNEIRFRFACSGEDFELEGSAEDLGLDISNSSLDISNCSMYKSGNNFYAGMKIQDYKKIYMLITEEELYDGVSEVADYLGVNANKENYKVTEGTSDGKKCTVYSFDNDGEILNVYVSEDGTVFKFGHFYNDKEIFIVINEFSGKIPSDLMNLDAAEIW